MPRHRSYGRLNTGPSKALVFGRRRLLRRLSDGARRRGPSGGLVGTLYVRQRTKLLRRLLPVSRRGRVSRSREVDQHPRRLLRSYTRLTALRLLRARERRLGGLLTRLRPRVVRESGDEEQAARYFQDSQCILRS